MIESPFKKERAQVGPWLLVIGAILLSIVSYHAIAWLTQPPEMEISEEPVSVLTVEVDQVRQSVFPSELSITGSVEARERLEVGSEVGGLRIVEVLVEEGDRVAEGQLLVRLNSELLGARLQQLEARAQQQQASVAKARQPERPLEVAQLRSAWQQAVAHVAQLKAEVQVAEAAVADAQRTFGRFKSLLDEGAVPRSDYDLRELEIITAKGQLEAAQTRLTSAEFAARQAQDRLRLAEEGGRAEDVTMAVGQLQEIQAQINEVQAQLAQTEIRAPRAGWVLKREAHLGEIPSPGKALVVLAQGGELELKGLVPENLVDAVKPGMEVSVTRGGQQVKGRVSRVSPEVDPGTRNAQIRIELPREGNLLPGMFVEAVIELGEQQSPAVPVEAVLGERPNEYVFVVVNGVAKQRPVQIGLRNQDQVSILSGLEVGEPVVVRGGGFLRDGDPVEHS